MDDQLEEFVFVRKRVEPEEEVVIYRDMDDLGRVFVTKETLKRFFIEQPAFKIALDGETVLYEIDPVEAIRIIEHSKNSYAPYNVRYQNFDFDNEIKDNARNNILNVTDEITVYRDVNNPDIAYVEGSVIKRFGIKPTSSLLVNDIEVFAVTPVQIINIINNANNKFAPYGIKYVNIELDQKDNKDDLPKHVEEDEYIGPRRRILSESDDHYAAYLEGFYDGMDYAKKRATRQNDPFIRGEESLGKEYSEYLSRKYYDKSVNQLLKNNVEKIMGVSK